MQKRIPISKAKELSEQYGWDKIIIIGIDGSDGSDQVVTYKNTKALCKTAGELGDKLDNLIDKLLPAPRDKDDKGHFIYNKEIPKCMYIECDMDGEHCSIHKGSGVGDTCVLRHYKHPSPSLCRHFKEDSKC